MPQTSLSLPFFDDAHRHLLPAFRRWVAAELSGHEACEGGDGVHAREIFQRLGAGNWLAPSVTPRAASVAAPDIRTVCLLREALAYSSAMADVAFSEPWLAILPIVLFGSDEQRRLHIPAYCRGSQLLAFALSEPDAGSDVAAITTRVAPTPHGCTIDGVKTWTSNAGLADGYVVFGKLADGAGKAAMAAVLVDGRRPEITLQQRLRVSSPHTVGTLSFENCPAHAPDAVVGRLGQGFEVAMRSLAMFRPTVAAACVGFARRALDEALARAKTGHAFGRPMADHQVIQARLAEMATAVESAALLTYQAAWHADLQTPEADLAASMAKLTAAETAGKVVDEAVQIFGATGVVKGTTVERLHRHVRAFRIFDGTSEIQRLIIARALFGRSAAA